MSKTINDLIRALESGKSQPSQPSVPDAHGPECACVRCMFGDEPGLACGCDDQGPSFKCQSEGLWHCEPPPPNEEEE